MGCDLEVVQIGMQAVASGDPGDGLVAGVHDDVFALAEAELEHRPLHQVSARRPSTSAR